MSSYDPDKVLDNKTFKKLIMEFKKKLESYTESSPNISIKTETSTSDYHTLGKLFPDYQVFRTTTITIIEKEHYVSPQEDSK